MADDREMVLQTIVVVMSRRRLDEHESTATLHSMLLIPHIRGERPGRSLALQKQADNLTIMSTVRECALWCAESADQTDTKRAQKHMKVECASLPHPFTRCHMRNSATGWMDQMSDPGHTHHPPPPPTPGETNRAHRQPQHLVLRRQCVIALTHWWCQCPRCPHARPRNQAQPRFPQWATGPNLPSGRLLSAPWQGLQASPLQWRLIAPVPWWGSCLCIPEAH